MSFSNKISGDTLGRFLKELKNMCCNRIFKRHLHDKKLPPEHCAATAKKHMDVHCKVALITGGSTGIGLATASALLNAGAKNVALIGLETCPGKCAVDCLNNCYGKNKAMFIKANINCAGQLEEAFEAVRKTHGKIDIVVNSAGILNGCEWEKEVQTNLIGTIRGTLLAYKYVGREGYGKGGVVINISGTSGLKPLPPAPTLAACQHGIIGLSRSFGDAYHVSKSNVRIVTLCPGFTQTNFIKNVEEDSMTDEMGASLKAAIEKAKKQNAEACGQAALHLIKYANSASIWVIEASRLFLVTLPNIKCHSELIAQFL